ncbi:MAG TPA: WD40 repeat domain-containing protein [Cytophagales bacterium]|nr:WD40 repeat domain-containing protein [Cytophagales bacterium]
MKVHVEKIASLSGHRDCVYTLEGTDKPNIFFSAGGDGMVVKWDLTTPDIGKLVVTVPKSIYAICHVARYNHLVVGQNFEGIHIIDLESNKEIKSLKTENTSIFDLQFFEDKLLVAFGNGLISVLDYNSLETKFKVKLSEKSARCISINKACGEFAVGYSDNYIRVFDLKDFKLKYEFLAHENSVFTVKYSSDSKFLFSGSRDARLKKWDVFNGYSLENSVVAHMYAINNLSLSPDFSHFVTCSMDKTIKLWNEEEMKLLKVIDKARHAGHGTSVNKLLWTSYENQLISCSDDKMLAVWKIEFRES